MAAGISDLIEFVDGDTIKAADFNNNFLALAYESNQQDGRIANLESNYLDNDFINVRAYLSKTTADSVCGSATAMYVPWSYRGQTGDDICAGDTNGLTACNSVKYSFVDANNSSGTYAPRDLACNEAVTYAWPWGHARTFLSTLGPDWDAGDTYIVCCQ